MHAESEAKFLSCLSTASWLITQELMYITTSQRTACACPSNTWRRGLWIQHEFNNYLTITYMKLCTMAAPQTCKVDVLKRLYRM